uniref:Uncharacterized protein n=1 Tax=Panagrolaimus sp. ES5 TaxID=591445 RepID=A0AC34F6R7_9BILA
MEYDAMSANDEVAVEKVNPDGSYKVKGCTYDSIAGIQLQNIVIFLKFEHVCESGDYYTNYDPYPNLNQTWNLKDQSALWIQDNYNGNSAPANTFGASLDQEKKSDVNPKFQHLSKSLPNPSASSSDGANESAENRDSSASARSNVVKNVRPMHRRKNISHGKIE